MKLASIFTDHMVLQANKPIRIFGEGKGKGQISFCGECVEFNSKEDNWCVTLPKKEYGGPFFMEITLNDEKSLLTDIYIGEVWIAAGQSNMEMPLFRTEYGFEAAKNGCNNKIRLFNIPRRVKADTPMYGWHFEKSYSKDTPWEICTEESALHFSAIGFYAAEELCKKLNKVIGIINCSWGGQPIETFINRDYFQTCEPLMSALNSYNKMMDELDTDEYEKKFQNALDEWEKHYKAIAYDEVERVRELGVRAMVGLPENSLPWLPNGPYVSYQPGCLFDAMIKRIIPFSVQGVLWYQGESNLANGYMQKYSTFMKCIRESFMDEEISFYAIELASFSNWWSDGVQDRDDRFAEGYDNWAFTREEQQKITEHEKNNYLTTSMELGSLYDIHPIQKKELTRRLIKKVLKYSYNFDIYADQPTYREAVFDEGKVYIYLNNASGLYSKFLDGVKMYVSDETHILKRAKIQIDNERLIIESDEVKKPVLVRYAFDFSYTGAHIYNKAGLPLAPFRTDKD